MKKKISLTIIIFTILTTSGLTSIIDPKRCTEQASMLKRIDLISQLEILKKNEILQLILPFDKNLDPEIPTCRSNDKTLKDKAGKVLRVHKESIPILEKMCSQLIPKTKDLELVAAIHQEINGSTDALEFLGKPTDNCTKLN